MILGAKSKKLVENSHSLGLGASYSQARNFIKDLSKVEHLPVSHKWGVYTKKSEGECVHNYC